MCNVFGYIIYCRCVRKDLGKNIKRGVIWEEVLFFNFMWVIFLNDLIINYGVYRENF